MTISNDCIKAALSGFDMRVFLEPNTSLNFSVKEEHYIECYDLPFILINDGTIWGTSRRNHLIHRQGSDQMSVCSFCYAPDIPFYGVTSMVSVSEAAESDAINLKLMPIIHYSEIRFSMKSSYQAVWKYGDEDLSKTCAAINDCKKFKIALQIEDGTWIITSVDLAFYYPESNNFRIRPEIDFLPHMLMMTDQLLGFIKENNPEFLSSKSPYQDVSMRVQNYCVFNSIDNNGNYYNLEQIPASAESNYKDAILFAEAGGDQV